MKADEGNISHQPTLARSELELAQHCLKESSEPQCKSHKLHMLGKENPICISLQPSPHTPAPESLQGSSHCDGFWFLLQQPDSPHTGAQVLAMGHPLCLCFAPCRAGSSCWYLQHPICSSSQPGPSAKPVLLRSNSPFFFTHHWKPCFQSWPALHSSASCTQGRARLRARALCAFQPALANECLPSQKSRHK